jgi:methionine aminopeptidase
VSLHYCIAEALKAVVESLKVGASTRAACILGDKILLEETGKQFKKEKDLKKGIKTSTYVMLLKSKVVTLVPSSQG